MTYNTQVFTKFSSHFTPPVSTPTQEYQVGLENQARKAFVAVKKLLCQDCVLTHYDVSKPLKLYCDASASGLGACLVHQMPDRSEHPVAYASRTLTAPE